MASMSVATANPEFDLVPLGSSYENHTTRRMIVDRGEGNQGAAFRRYAASVSHVDAVSTVHVAINNSYASEKGALPAVDRRAVELARASWPWTGTQKEPLER
ncbi:hypothetical protein GT037_007167 [Alternaria burnsii]|uniref:Uncharacterized protein n=1 Tax=Alternaria burnsii TaxID=1187904 RepID=A0A8H7B3P1_9PLEO|nr:uncharacterized protein GT037_007167 [Alternaria burnsii]KAF7674407.1 hypothetical protein GT037_007167 [Alternaria burnsii]